MSVDISDLDTQDTPIFGSVPEFEPKILCLSSYHLRSPQPATFWNSKKQSLLSSKKYPNLRAFSPLQHTDNLKSDLENNTIVRSNSQEALQAITFSNLVLGRHSYNQTLQSFEMGLHSGTFASNNFNTTLQALDLASRSNITPFSIRLVSSEFKLTNSFTK